MYQDEWLAHAQMIVDIGDNVLFISYSLCMGFFFAKLIKPFLYANKKRAALIGALYAAFMVFNTLYPFNFPKGVGSAVRIGVGFLFLYLFDRTRPRQKLFLSILFYTLVILCMQLDSEQQMYFSDFIFDVLPFNTTPERTILLFILTLAENALFFLFALAVGVTISQRLMSACEEEITYRDLMILSLPFFVVFFHMWIYENYYNLYGKYFLLLDEIGDSKTLKTLSFNSLPRLVSFLILYAFILVFLWCFFDIKKMAKESLDAAVLEEKTKDLQHHIQQMGRMYDEIHAIRHDITHHTEVLSSLLREGKHSEAMSYLSSMKTFVRDNGAGISTGHPVTDIILSEKAAEAAADGILFSSTFAYPTDFGFDPFDVSGILGNALSNALNASRKSEGVPAPSVTIQSFVKRNTYMIEIQNTYDGILLFDDEGRLPIRRNKDSRHGFGISNIQKIAQKYDGDLTMEQSDHMVILSVILQRRREAS